MTQEQFSNESYKAFRILEADGVVIIKCYFKNTDRAAAFLREYDFIEYTLGIGNVSIAVKYDPRYDANEVLGYVLSEMQFRGATKIKSI